MDMDEAFTADDVFKALADPHRRQLLDGLNAKTGQTLRELCAGLAMARQSVSKHLAVLEAANLVTTAWRGREKLHYLNAEPINAIADRWINQYDRPRARALADLKTALESQSMSDSWEFVYTTYIRTTPEKLWTAITDPAFSRSYMGHGIESEWTKGSTYAWVEGDYRIEHPDQVILEADPYRRLAFTFHTFVPEIRTIAPSLTEEKIAELATERRSQVAFDIEQDGDRVKLTVVHDGFDPDSQVLGMISNGWPSKLAELKSGLEAS